MSPDTSKIITKEIPNEAVNRANDPNIINNERRHDQVMHAQTLKTNREVPKQAPLYLYIPNRTHTGTTRIKHKSFIHTASKKPTYRTLSIPSYAGMPRPAIATRSSPMAAAMVLVFATVITCPLLAASAQPAPSMPPPSPPAATTNNSRLEKAYVALQALKRAITDDPKKLTHNWCGPDVCNYFGVFCAPAPDDPCQRTVAGVDLNHGDLAGTLPEELGLLSDLAVFHLNSNRFCGSLPESLRSLHLLHEIDVSNNQLSGGFPSQLLCLPNLQYVDIR
jgi:hypothetical protein